MEVTKTAPSTGPTTFRYETVVETNARPYPQADGDEEASS